MRNLLAFITLSFLLAVSCARQSAPTGGPKDTIPPILNKSIPAQNQINYKGKTIELTFSEMIILNNPKEQIIIAPTTTTPYDIINRNNKVLIKFEEPLKDSVTYSINFRESIKDITEKNPALNLQLAFSTGTYIDSLSIAGKVFDLVKGTIPKEATVAIFEHQDTLSIFKHKPSYLTKTDLKGNFRLNNLKPGRYSIYAIEDKNKNLIADSKSESYGFLAQPILLLKDTQSIQIPTVRLDARPLKLTSARPYNNYFNIKTAKNLVDYMATNHNTGDTLISSFGEDHANVRIYNTFQSDSTLIKFSAIDSIGNALDTSLYIKFSTRAVTPDKFSMNAEGIKLLQEKGQLEISIQFNKPTVLANPDSLLFQIDSANIIPVATGEITWNEKTNHLRITKKIDPKLLKVEIKDKKQSPPKPKDKQVTGEDSKPIKREIRNQLIIGKGAFISIDNDTVSRYTKDVKPLLNEELGAIILIVQTEAKNFIAQLLDKDFIVIRQTTNSKQVRWENLTPGNYRIRLQIDLNNNGKWDPGNYLKKEQPEPIIYYLNEKSNPVNTTVLKANWEVYDLLIKY